MDENMVNSGLRDGVLANVIQQYQMGVREPEVPTDMTGPTTLAVVNSFSDWLGAPVTLVYRSGGQFYNLVLVEQLANQAAGNQETGQAEQTVGTAIQAKKAGKIPRPPNAWILYRKFHHGSVRDANPGLMNVDLSKIISQMWKKESPASKDKWHAKAAQVKAEHQKKYPSYTYSPRKPGEKKRRVTKAAKRRTAVIQQMLTTVTMPEIPNSATPTFDAIDGFNTFDCPGLNDFTIPVENGPQFDLDLDDPMFNLINFDTEFPNVEEAYPVLETMLDKHTVNMNLPAGNDPAADNVTMSLLASNEMDFTKSFLPGLCTSNQVSHNSPQTINPAMLSLAQTSTTVAVNSAPSVNTWTQFLPQSVVTSEQSRQEGLNATTNLDSHGIEDGAEATFGTSSA